MRISGNIQPRDLSRTNLNMMRLIEDGVIEREFAGAVQVNVAEAQISRGVYFHRIRKWRIGADDAIEIKIGEREIATIVDIDRQAIRPFSALLFHLQRVDSPIRNVSQLDLVADMVLAGHRINPSFGRRVRNE